LLAVLRCGNLATNQIDYLGTARSRVRAFNKLVAESFTVLSVTSGHFRVVAKFVDQHTLGLGAGDGPHLATASG
jgi:hypothetical protein